MASSQVAIMASPPLSLLPVAGAGAGVPVIGTPEDFMFEEEYHFDTVSHLTERGARLRTSRLADLLEHDPAFARHLASLERIAP